MPVLTAVEEPKFTVHRYMSESDGGCAITGYELWRDDGAGSDTNIAIDAATIEN